MDDKHKKIAKLIFDLANAMEIDAEELFPEISDHLFESRFQQDEVFKYLEALNLKEE